MKQLSLVLSMIFALFCGAASAGSIPCADYALPGNSLNALSGSDGCEIGSTNNHDTAQVNADTMFDSDNWGLLAKFELDNGMTFAGFSPPPVLVQFSDLYTAGNISIDWSNYTNDIMVVFKDGAGEPPLYVGHLLSGWTYGDSGANNYQFESPFLNGASLKDISNMAFYSRPRGRDPRGGGTVDLPGTGALVLAGGLMLTRRRFLQADG